MGGLQPGGTTASVALPWGQRGVLLLAGVEREEERPRGSSQAGELDLLDAEGVEEALLDPESFFLRANSILLSPRLISAAAAHRFFRSIDHASEKVMYR